MFDHGTNTVLLALVLGASIFSLSAEKFTPRAALTTAVDTTQLPPVPMTASWDGAPAQADLDAIDVTLGDGFNAELMTSYVLEGLVVTRREFRHDPTSAVSPLDLGIVWGDLAEPGGIDGIEFRAAPRSIRFRSTTDAERPANWKHQVTNNHLIPANQAVLDALMAIEPGTHVRIRGYLVEVTGERISRWRSSTRRDDNTFIGGCEIILVSAVEVLPSNQSAAAARSTARLEEPT